MPWGREDGSGNCKRKETTWHSQTLSVGAAGTDPQRSFSKKQFSERGSSSGWRSSPRSRCTRFGRVLISDHSCCQRRLRLSRLRSSSSFALAYVARTRTFTRRSHFRPSHFCSAPFTIFCSSCVFATVDAVAASTAVTIVLGCCQPATEGFR